MLPSESFSMTCVYLIESYPKVKLPSLLVDCKYPTMLFSVMASMNVAEKTVLSSWLEYLIPGVFRSKSEELFKRLSISSILILTLS